MPQVTNAAHGGTPANTQYQKNYSSHHVPYGTTKGKLMYSLLSLPQTLIYYHELRLNKDQYWLSFL